MSAPLRFLALVVVGWGAMRFVVADELSLARPFAPTAEALAAVPPIAVTQFPPIAPLEPPPAYYPPPYGVMPPAVPYYYPVPVPIRQASAPVQSAAASSPYAPQLDFALLDDRRDSWSLASLANGALPPRQSAPVPSVPPAPAVPAKLDRWQLSSWALLREQRGAPTLASGGMLGGSQAGMRLTYAVNRSLAASLRTTSPVGGRGVEVALGARYQPLRSVPVWLTAERRQAIGRDAGRSAFALFAEGGVYQVALPWRTELDAYAQAGVVGVRSRDLFADGAMTLTRPVFRNYSAGFGVWAGYQPGLYRVDAGPRLSMRVRNNIRVHVDYRQRLAGEALPGSGPALTLAADF